MLDVFRETSTTEPLSASHHLHEGHEVCLNAIVLYFGIDCFSPITIGTIFIFGIIPLLLLQILYN